MEAPLVLRSINMIELLVKICVNCDLPKSAYCAEVNSQIENAVSTLPEDKRARLIRRLQRNEGHAVPLSRANIKALKVFGYIFGEVEEGIDQ